ncbi:extracellular solute-binding protein [Kutzneria chonburiensis]|uniref:Extracellular solute-binding protein n=1 Tax=Kutzneria chonburiensis TaxID=1483604 RepID=A0ABV6N311_9PSEU|nr:extracellular solute-binding protein [Kutzneria chonburiensis]
MVAAGCGGGASSGSGGDKTLTVWLMSGSAPDATVAAIDKDFEAAHPGVKVKYEVQQWNGIGQKLTTALTSGGPDVIELGNTQVAQYSSTGTLLDVTDAAGDLNGSQWLSALKEEGAWQGKQYGVPFYAANRVVIYRTDLFQQAGITAPPTSNDEWLSDLTKLKGIQGVDPLYLPGQDWYVWLSFLWDQGGDLATSSGDTFKSAINSPAGKAAFEFYKKLGDTSGSPAPKDADEATPQQSDVVAKGNTASFIGFGYELAAVEKANPALKGKFGAFPIPSKTAGKTAPVFLGGSDLAIPANTKNADLAKDWLKIETSAKYQGQLAANGVVPGTSTDSSALDSTATGKAMAAGAKNGKGTPTTPKWAAVEADNPIKAALTAYLTGQKSLDQAVADADAAINKSLSAS